MNVIERKVKATDKRVSELAKLVQDVSNIYEMHGNKKALFCFFGYAQCEIDRMKSDAAESREMLDLIGRFEAKARAVTPDE